jgi:hypothetical protein
MNLRSFLALSSTLTVCLSAASTADWPQWRGPNQDGSIRMSGLPSTLSPANKRWSTPLPGKAGSTPVVSGNRVFLTSPDDQKNLQLMCLDRTSGQVLWSRTVGVGDKEVGRNNTCAPSPIRWQTGLCALRHGRLRSLRSRRKTPLVAQPQ